MVVVVVGWGPHLILITAIPTTELQQSPGKVDDDDHPTGNDNGQDDTIESAFVVQESMMEKVHKTKWFALIFSNVGCTDGWPGSGRRNGLFVNVHSVNQNGQQSPSNTTPR